MFNDFNEFSDWLDISKNLTGDMVRDMYDFINTFPSAGIDDYIKVTKKLSEGASIEQVKARFKKHMNSIGEKDTDSYVEIVRMEDVQNEMWESAKKGSLKGETTHVPLFDNAWKWRLSEFTLFTGYNNDGKSLFLRNLCLIKGIVDKWPTACYAPEDYPAVSFFDELIHTASGYSTDKDNPNFAGEDIYKSVIAQIKPYFTFVNIRPPKNTLEAILKAFIPLIEKHGVKICVIDPLVKITRPKEYLNNDAQWSAYVTQLCTDFARRFNVCLIMVLHQLTPKLQENGTYAKPDKYSIKSGGNLSDSSDNVLFLQRPEAPRDLISTLVRFGSLKIKKQKLVAVPQEVICKFNRRTNRYVDELMEEDLFPFDQYLEIPRIKLLF